MFNKSLVEMLNESCVVFFAHYEPFKASLREIIYRSLLSECSKEVGLVYQRKDLVARFVYSN